MPHIGSVRNLATHPLRTAEYAVMVDDEAIAALNACNYLFLAKIKELDNNGLRMWSGRSGQSEYQNRYS